MSGASDAGALARARWQIHLCVVLWGFTAILGKLISLPAAALVWWRMLLVTASLALLPRVWHGVAALAPRRRWALAGVGVVIALHWLTFYGAIKLANASVAATSIALGPVFLAVLEPFLSHQRFRPSNLVVALAAVVGVALVVGGIPAGMRLGLAVGALSALLVAVFGALNKRLVEGSDALAMTFLELGAGAAALTLIGPALSVALPGDAAASPFAMFQPPGLRDAALLLLLALACTLLPFALSLVALRRLSAFEAQLAVNLEPVYAVILAVLLLDEQRDLGALFFAGMALIIGAVVVPWWTGRTAG